MRKHLLLSTTLCLIFNSPILAEDEITQDTPNTEVTYVREEAPQQTVETAVAAEPEQPVEIAQVEEAKPVEVVQTAPVPEPFIEKIAHPEYSLRHILNQGESLYLNDLSGWSIKNSYRDVAAQWQIGDRIQLTYFEITWFMYKVELCNLTRNESVFATLKDVPDISNADALLIESISTNSGHLKLSNGTFLHALGTWEVKHSGWKAGDLVTLLYWGEVDGKPAHAIWNHETNAIIGEMLLLGN